jgi:MinD-like ATPase involved in chromosome partitioning or flagellar assembly
MSLAWGETIGRLLLAFETWPGVTSVEKVCVVRDLQGQIRLAVRPSALATVDHGGLENRLRTELGRWFARPVLWTREPSTLEEQRLARNLLQRLDGKWPQTWPRGYDDGLGRGSLEVKTGSGGRWCGEQRARTKDVWLQQGTVDVPWDLSKDDPAIVSFYSFKGGVGRTTTMGIVARHLARQGSRVVVVDLDLEAPGLGRLFDVQTERGVLDLLAEHAATGKIDTDDPATYCATVELEQEPIIVYPVGNLDPSYIERLASLDYASRPGDGRSAVEAALRDLLVRIKRRHRPDYVLLDARAGLHDLGGLSLHALAHVDVLIGRSGASTRDGFELVLEALSRRRKKQDLRVVMVQSFVPVEGGEQQRAREAWAAVSYEIFSKTVYSRLYSEDGEDLPSLDEGAAMHFPWVIPNYGDPIGRVDRLIEIDDPFWTASPYKDLTERIVERCGRLPPEILREHAESEEGLDDDDGD